MWAATVEQDFGNGSQIDPLLCGERVGELISRHPHTRMHFKEGIIPPASQTDRRTRGSEAVNLSHPKSSHLMLFDDCAFVYLHHG